MVVLVAAIIIIAILVIALIVFLCVNSSSKKENDLTDFKETTQITNVMPPQEDPTHDIERIYFYPGVTGVWLCKNCECENNFGYGRCCVCGHEK